MSSPWRREEYPLRSSSSSVSGPHGEAADTDESLFGALLRICEALQMCRYGAAAVDDWLTSLPLICAWRDVMLPLRRGQNEVTVECFGQRLDVLGIGVHLVEQRRLSVELGRSDSRA